MNNYFVSKLCKVVKYVYHYNLYGQLVIEILLYLHMNLHFIVDNSICYLSVHIILSADNELYREVLLLILPDSTLKQSFTVTHPHPFHSP